MAWSFRCLANSHHQPSNAYPNKIPVRQRVTFCRILGKQCDNTLVSVVLFPPKTGCTLGGRILLAANPKLEKLTSPPKSPRSSCFSTAGYESEKKMVVLSRRLDASLEQLVCRGICKLMMLFICG